MCSHNGKRENVTQNAKFILLNTLNKIKETIKHFPLVEIVTDIKNLDFSKVEDGIMIIYASWSGQAVLNNIATVELLKEIGFNNKLIVIDTDIFSPEQYISTFGQTLGGSGEIFIIKNGKITEKYVGSNPYNEFRNKLEKLNKKC